MFTPSGNMKKVSLDVIEKLEDELKEDPLDYNKWKILIGKVLAKDKEEQVKSVFNRYLEIFKFDGTQWCNYINYLLNRGEFQQVEREFAKCLPSTAHVELSRLYVSYVRRTNDVITGGENARGVVIQAFEFAVFKVGIDLMSTQLWNDYLEFLKSWTPAASWEQQQKIDLIRKVYKKLLAIPTEKIESSWSTYAKWENSVNSSTASRFIAEKSADFMEARSWNTEWHNLTDGQLKRETLPARIDDKHKRILYNQINIWHRWLEFEKKNKLNLSEEQLSERIEYVYKQSLYALPFVPEMWFRYSKFLLDSPNDTNLSRCIKILEEGISLNPKSYLLTFMLAELYEKESNLEKTVSIFKNLIALLCKDFEKCKTSIADIIEEASTVKQNDMKDSELENGEATTSHDGSILYGFFQLSEIKAKELIKLKKEQKTLSDSITLVYLKYMTAAKRSFGIKEARKVFKSARDDCEAIGYQMFVENALMEFHSENLSVANRIFDFGMTRFKGNGHYLIKYLDFLLMTNKAENMKVVFESGLSTLLDDVKKVEEQAQINKSEHGDVWAEYKISEVEEKKQEIKLLIEKMISCQTIYGDMGLIKSLDGRFQEYFPNDDYLDFFSNRYSDYGITPIMIYDLGILPDENKKAEIVIKQPKVEESVAEEVIPQIVNENSNAFSQSKSFVRSNIYNLLRSLPNSSYFGPPEDHVFNSSKLVDFFTNLPGISDT